MPPPSAGTINLQKGKKTFLIAKLDRRVLFLFVLFFYIRLFLSSSCPFYLFICLALSLLSLFMLLILPPQCLLLFICEISRLFSSPIPSPCTPHSPPASFALRPELHDLPAKLPPTLHDKPEWSPMNLCLSALSAHLSSGYLVSCRL